MQRTAAATIKGIKIVKRNYETYECTYNAKKGGATLSLYVTRPTGKGETVYVPTGVLTAYIVRVVDSCCPDPDNVADVSRSHYETELNARLADGWRAGKRKVELCLNSLYGKCVAVIEITPYDEVYVQVGNEPCAVVRVGNDEKVFRDGDRIEYDDLVSMMTE